MEINQILSIFGNQSCLLMAAKSKGKIERTESREQMIGSGFI
jgi:hypothetical protein